MPIPPRPVPTPLPEDPGTLQLVAGIALGITGGALLATRRRLPPHVRSAATVAGLALLGAAVQRPAIDALRRAGNRRRNAEIRLSFLIPHPVERVFAFCRDFENFPRFIRSLREVHDYGDGRSHWCAVTPSGRTVEWNAVVTKYVPNSVIGWQSVGRSSVQSNGIIRVRPERGATCMQVTITYAVRDGRMVDDIAALARPPRSEALAEDIHALARYLEQASEADLAASVS